MLKPISSVGEVTLLRGFCHELGLLKTPTLHAIQVVAEHIGLRVMTEENYQEVMSQLKEITTITTDHIIADQEIIDDSIQLVTKLKFIVFSQKTESEKLLDITRLITYEAISH